MMLSPRHTISLRPYQIDIIQSVLNPPTGIWRQLIVAATGSGKTVIMSSLIDRLLKPGQKALVLAHREELLNQAKTEIEGLVPDLLVELEQAQNRATRGDHLFGDSRRHVVVGSVQTMRGKRLESWARDAFDVVLIDEAHHAASVSYVDIVTHFGCMESTVRTPLIGVTATPNRSDGVGLGSVFQYIAASYGIRELVELGFLCGIRAINIQSQVDIRDIKIRQGDFAAGELEQAVDDDDRNALLVSAYKKYARNRPAVAFTAGVDHAHHLADWFRSSGVPAESVWGAMDKDERRAAFSRYKTGETMVLTNFGILTEGWNEPKTSCVLLARPTKSSLLLTQMVGRGTRLFPGKDDCLVIDVKDVTDGKSIVSVPTLAGLPANFDAQGEELFKASKKFEKLDPRLAVRVTSLLHLDEMLAKVENGMSVLEIDLMAATRVDPYVEAHSRFTWSALTDSRYRVSPDKGINTFEITADTLGSWNVLRLRKDFPTETLTKTQDLAQAFQIADSAITQICPTTALIDAKAGWRKNPPSDSQLALLDKLGVAYPSDITKGQASALISARLGRK